MADGLRIQVDLDVAKFQSQLDALIAKGSKTGFTPKVDPRPLANYNTQARESIKLNQLFGSGITDIFTKFLKWYAISGIVTGIFTSIREGIDDVIALDSALTNISFTMDLTNSQFLEIADNAHEVAIELGSVSDSVLEATQIYANMNETLESVNQKSEASIVLANLTGDTVARMADAVQGSAFAFDLQAESADHVADVLSYIASTTGVAFDKSIKGMTDSISIAGNVANETGLSFEQFAAIVATTQEATRLSGNKVASGLTTVFSRISRVSSLTGEEVSKLEGGFQSLGIQIRDQTTGEFLDMWKILQNIDAVWGDLSSTERSYVAELAAGVRQRKVFLGVMKNFDQITQRASDSLLANGFALEQNDKFVDSLQGQINKLTETNKEFFRTLISQDAISNTVGVMTDLIEVLTVLADHIGIVDVAIKLMVASFATKKILPFVTLLPTLIVDLQLLAVGIKYAGTEVDVLGKKVEIAGAKAKIFAGGIGIVIAILTTEFIKAMIDAKNSTEALSEALDSFDSTAIDSLVSDGAAAEVDALASKILSLKKSYEELNNSLNLADGKAAIAETQQAMRDIEVQLLKLNVKIEDVDVALEKLGKGAGFVADDIYDDLIREKNERIKVADAVLFQVDRQKALEAVQEKEEERIEFLIENYSLLSDNKKAEVDNYIQGEIDKTNALISETKKRIEAYKAELSAIISTASGQDALSAEKKYTSLIPFLQEQIDDLEFSRNKLVQTQTKMHKTREKSAKELTDSERALLAVEFEIAKAQAELSRIEGRERIPAIENLIRLENERQSAIASSIKSLNKEKLGADEYTKQLSSLVLQQEASITAIYEFSKELRQIPIDEQKEKLKEYKEELDDLNDKLKKAKSEFNDQIDSAIDSLEEEQDASHEAYQSEIDDLEKKLDRIEKNNEAKEDAIRLARLERAEQEKANQLKNVQEEENTRIYIDGRFVFTADPNAVADAQEELANATEALEDEKRDQRNERRTDNLQSEIDNLKEQQDESKKSFDKQIGDLKKFKSDYQKQIEKSGEIEEELLRDITDALREVNGSYFKDTIDGYRNMVDDINDILGDINTSEGDISSTEDSISSGSRAGARREYDSLKEKQFVGLTSAAEDRKIKNLSEEHGFKNGGVIKKGGLAYVHGEEPILSKEMTANVAEALNVSGSTPMQSARNIVNYAGNPQAVESGVSETSTDNSVTIKEMKVVTNSPSQFVNGLKNLVTING